MNICEVASGIDKKSAPVRAAAFKNVILERKFWICMKLWNRMLMEMKMIWKKSLKNLVIDVCLK